MSATIDNIIFNPLEKALRADFNDAQSYAGRHVGELARFDAGMYPDILGDGNGDVQRCGGLSLDVHGSGDLLVKRGYLMLVSDTLPSAIGALDSPARVGLLDADFQVTVPDLGGGVIRHYLVQARVTETTTNENRDIFNPGTQTYDPPASIPKRLTHGVEISLKVGTVEGQIPAPDAGYVAIGAVYKSAANPITTAGLVDLRPLPGDQVGLVSRNVASTDNRSYPLCREYRVGFGAATTMHGRWAAMVNGFLAVMRTPTAGTNPALLKHSTDSNVANRWYYLYLGQNQRGATVNSQPRGRVGNAYGDGTNMPSGNAIMALSSVAPTRGVNSAVVPLVSPFEGLSAAAGSMTCVGAIRRNSGNTGWDSITSSASGVVTMTRLFALTIDQNSGVADTANKRAITVDLATGGTGGERLLPVGAFSASGTIGTSADDTTGTARQVTFLFQESAAGTTMSAIGTWLTTNRASKKTMTFAGIPIPNAGDSFFVGLEATTDVDNPSLASTSAIGTGNTWGLLFTGFAW